MQMLDWLIVAAYFVITVAIGLAYSKTAGKSTEHFFLGGRNLTWYIAGLSMVATTFAADTPLAVAEIVGQSGVAGNWLWWCFLAGGMLTTFFFARLWRRSGVLTEVEFVEMRYSGAPARFLRGFKSIYLGLFMNVVIIGWVNVAMIDIFEIFLDMSRADAVKWVAAAMLVTAAYSSVSGLLGVAITDAIQFVIAMGGCIVLAVLVVNSGDIGGVQGMQEKLGAIQPHALDLLPAVGQSAGDGAGKLGLSLMAFLAFVGVQWWASWYPGAEPGGGGYVAQRMMSARTERDSVFATLFFQIAHYALRPWPWILVGLCAICLYHLPAALPDEATRAKVEEIRAAVGDSGYRIFTLQADQLAERARNEPAVRERLDELNALNAALREAARSDAALEKALVYSGSEKKGYVLAMRDYLPTGLKGLLLVAFLAAYMSTIATQLNWGAGYLINDFFRRFLAPEATEAQLVGASRLATFLLMALGLGLSFFMNSISGAWEFILQCGAGLGLVLILRWYWWRINAWSEIAATAAPFVATALLWNVAFEDPKTKYLLTVGFTTIVWIAVTYLTPPVDRATLDRFYEKVRPDGAWGPFRPDGSASAARLGRLALCWLAGIVLVYGSLFAIGQAILGRWDSAAPLLLLAAGAGALLYWAMGEEQ
jgi:Na+/proline symporter